MLYQNVASNTILKSLADQKMAETLSPEHNQRRIFLRFRTKDDAPSDSQIIQDFYTLTGLSDALCFVHWQSREERCTYVILDVHCGTELDVPRVQDLPHELYRLSWGSKNGTMSALLQKVVQYQDLTRCAQRFRGNGVRN